MKNKMQALKNLGFNYITRDMSGDITVWKVKPVRYVAVLKEYEKEAKEKFKDAEFEIDNSIDDDCEYKNGYNVDSSWFIRSKKDCHCDSVMHLNKNDREMAFITWENSPYTIDCEIDNSCGLKELGFKYIARDMNGELRGWMIKPIRVMQVLEQYKSKYEEQFKEADIRTEYATDNCYKDGCNVYFCSFQCSKKDKGEFYKRIQLDENDPLYKNITWENSPVEIV